MLLISKFLPLVAVAWCNVRVHAVIATPVQGAGHLRASQSPHSNITAKPWKHHSNGTMVAQALPANETLRMHLLAETRRHSTQSCGPNRMNAAPDVFDRIQSEMLGSHLDYACGCLEANYKSDFTQADATLEVGGPGMQKIFDVPPGQEKAQLCAALEWLSAFSPDTQCMGKMINNDNWQEYLC